MSVLVIGNTAIYTTSKVAGTTVRRWVIQSLGKELMNRHGHKESRPSDSEELRQLHRHFPSPLAERTLGLSGATIDQLDSLLQELRLSYHFGFFGHVDADNRYCIKRDPLNRFVSCISQKLGKEKFSAIHSIDQMLSDFDQLCLEPISQSPTNFSFNTRLDDWRRLIVARHFAPQYLSFGEDKSYFTEIFDITEVNKAVRPLLEDSFGFEIEPIVANKGKKKVLLSNGQEELVKVIYELDYNYGYC